MRRLTTVLCLLTAVLPGVAACATPQTRPGAAAPSASAAWSTYQAEVSGVTPGPGARAVTVQVEALAGGDGCSRNVRVDNQTEENGVIFADIVQDSAGSAIVGACPTFEPAEVTLTSTEPIGDRALSLNQKTWALKNGAYSRCDENLGCNPPKDRCDPTWTRAAVRGMDVSRHSQGHVEACDGKWLVMTVPDDPASCGVEPRPGCEVNTAVRRYFLRNEPAGWSIIARTTSGGCDAVRKAAITFPRELCANLKPTARLVTVAPTPPSGRPGG
ncbi:hypothetical protein AB0B97_17615 [Micromonospora sp. NPDC049004]|uniref:hypothetical protein n=1 Tax=Micromonospora sp. NPDC049004 TaxID=3154348 RepID=UPI0033C9B2EF